MYITQATDLDQHGPEAGFVAFGASTALASGARGDSARVHVPVHAHTCAHSHGEVNRDLQPSFPFAFINKYIKSAS